MKNRIVTAPSVILVAAPMLLRQGVEDFAEQEGIADYPLLYEDTPIGRIIDHVNGDHDGTHDDGEMLVEFAGRQCYNAWKSGRGTSEYLENIVETGHGSVLAHAHYSFQIGGISRGLSLELNRHSAGVDISQASMRFIDSSHVNFVAPPILLDIWNNNLDCESATAWCDARGLEMKDYGRVQAEIVAAMTDKLNPQNVKERTLIQKRANEAARYSLPHACETKGVWTFNIRALRHILSLRGAPEADLEIRRLAAALALQCKAIAPSAFRDIEIIPCDWGVDQVQAVYRKP